MKLKIAITRRYTQRLARLFFNGPPCFVVFGNHWASLFPDDLDELHIYLSAGYPDSRFSSYLPGWK